MKNKDKIEELKEEIKKLKEHRTIFLPENVWKMYLNGEVDLTNRLFSEFKDTLRLTNDIEIKRAELKGLQEGKAEARKIVEEDLKDILKYGIKTKDKKYFRTRFSILLARLRAK